jgi:hypothetical protein
MDDQVVEAGAGHDEVEVCHRLKLAHPQVGPGMITCGLVDLFLVRCYRRF